MVENSTGQHNLYPFKTFCYESLKNLLQQLLNRPGFAQLCERWCSRTITGHNTLHDVYDGKVWTDFQCYRGKPFLSESFTYGLMLNTDWMKPFIHLEYSVGAIYVSIMNLPREHHFKPENILLNGLISGP